MPFEYRGKLLAVRWFSPHTVVEIDLDTARCRALHATPHPFGAAGELHGGTAPLPFDDGRGGQHFLALARLRAGMFMYTSNACTLHTCTYVQMHMRA